MPTTIEQLELEVQSSSTSAVNGIDALSASLSKLKTATKGGVGLTSVANSVRSLDAALKSTDSSGASKIDKLVNSLEKLKNLGSIKISSSIGNQLKNISEAARSITEVDFSGIGKISESFKQLNGLNASGLKSTINALGKLPQLSTALSSVSWDNFENQIQRLSNSLVSLTSRLNTTSTAFNSLPGSIQRATSATSNVAMVNQKASSSYVNLWAKVSMAVAAVKHGAGIIASWIHQSNQYIEDLNLFTASMGEYAAEAQKYAEHVSEVMGIDPGEFMRNQGTFNTIISGFGVASDKAYLMSKNLTQLGYDIGSFFNISFESAMEKLQSGISGELEPLRRLGYDLSVARLQEEALTLGITKNVSAMTQAEKSQLRYYAIMTQVTTAQGDMARTLNAPANQLRVLRAQVTMCAKALGNIFIPILNAVVPYAIALAKVIRMVASIIAGLFHFKLPEVDYSGISTGASAMGDLANNAGSAAKGVGDTAKAAKKLKNAMLGIDELNVISPDDAASADGSAGGAGGIGGGGAGGIGGGDLGIDLPTYDFLSEAIKTKADAIVEKMKKWLGLNEDINTLSDLLHTRLGRILTTVGAIGLGFAAWHISKNFLSALEYLQNLKNLGLGSQLTIATGVSLSITGIVLEWSGIIDTIQHELNGMNFAQIIAGGLLTIGGGAILGKGIAGWIIKSFENGFVANALLKAAENLSLETATAAGGALGAAIGGIIAGIPMYITGIHDALTNGLNLLNGSLIPIGSTMAAAGIGAIIGACGGPITAGIGALIGLAIGLVTDGILLIKEHWGEIVTFLEEFFTVTIPEQWNKFKKWVKNLPSEVSEFFSKLWEPIENYDWYGLGKRMGTKLGTSIKNAIEFITKKVPKWFSSTWETIKTSFHTFVTQTVPNFFTKTVPTLYDTITESVVTFLTKTLPNKLSNIGDWFKDVGKAAWDGLVEGWKAGTKAVTDFVDGFVDGVKEGLGIHSPSTVFAEIGGFCIDGLFEGFDNISSTIGSWAEKNIISPFGEFAKKTIDGFNKNISSGYTSTKTTITTWGTGVKTWFTDKVNASSFGEFAKNIINGFKNKVGSDHVNTKSSMVTWGANIKNWFTSDSFGGVSTQKFQKFASAVIEGFKNKIGSTYTNTKSNIVTWGNSVKSWFSSIVTGTVFAGFAADIVDGFKNKITNYWSTAKSAMETFAKGVINGFNKPNGKAIVDSFIAIGKNIVQGFIDGVNSLWDAAMSRIRKFGESIISAGKKGTEEHSPSKAFKQIGAYVIEGFNIGIDDMIPRSYAMMDKWLTGINAYQPSMKLAVDTSDLRYYDSKGFSRAVSTNVNASSDVVMDNFKEGLIEFYKEYMAPQINSIEENTRRQVDENGQTVQGGSPMMQRNGGEQGGNFDVKVYLDGKQITAAVEKRQRERGATIYSGGVL